MEEIRLIKPSIDYAEDIMKFRQEIKEMFRQNLCNCKERNIYKVMVTCNRDNVASEKTIVACGGVFEKEICVDGKHIKRY